jgi:hypothetical protein
MYSSTYSDFTYAPTTWVVRLIFGELYWFFALFAWIIATNLESIEELKRRRSVPVPPISEFTKKQRRIRGIHEASILLLSFPAIFFLVHRQDDNTLFPSPPSALNPCSRVHGNHFWRCVRARSINLPERAIVAQHTRSRVEGEGNNHLDANKHTDNPSTAYVEDMYLDGDRIRFNHSDTPYYVNIDDESMYESIVRYLQERHEHELEQQYQLG